MPEPERIPWETIALLRGDRAISVASKELWSIGSLEALRLPTVAIVGTRAATAHGKALARRFAAGLASAGCCVLSGLALGIDAAAHEGALEAGGATIGVLGSGHARFFPARNRPLGERMIACGGAVLSPFRPEQQAKPWQFLERNGIVAALADAVVVIEAPARSGALNTASWAAGRIPVFAVPGDVDRPHVAGCHALIRDGATLARGPDDVLADLRIRRASPPPEPALQLPAYVGALEQRLLKALAAGECGLDHLIEAGDEAAPRVLAALSILELAGAIEARPGQRYSLR